MTAAGARPPPAVARPPPPGRATARGAPDPDVIRLDQSGSITHYAYDHSPLPHGGGTAAVRVVDGTILVSASAPTVTSGPAVYAVTFEDPATPGSTGIAHVPGTFSDTAPATPLNPGAPSQLALTDPDSNTIVPQSVPGVGGEFMLDSQGDQQEVFVKDPTSAAPQLSVLAISQSVDDTAFPASPGGKPITTNPTHDTVAGITGFQPGRAYSPVIPATPTTSPRTARPTTSAPSTSAPRRSPVRGGGAAERPHQGGDGQG
jgi:hypothetical protein